jgi:hypothetical protein
VSIVLGLGERYPVTPVALGTYARLSASESHPNKDPQEDRQLVPPPTAVSVGGGQNFQFVRMLMNYDSEKDGYNDMAGRKIGSVDRRKEQKILRANGDIHMQKERSPRNDYAEQNEERKRKANQKR